MLISFVNVAAALQGSSAFGVSPLAFPRGSGACYMQPTGQRRGGAPTLITAPLRLNALTKRHITVSFPYFIRLPNLSGGKLPSAFTQVLYLKTILSLLCRFEWESNQSYTSNSVYYPRGALLSMWKQLYEDYCVIRGSGKLCQCWKLQKKSQKQLLDPFCKVVVALVFKPLWCHEGQIPQLFMSFMFFLCLEISHISL